MWLLYHANTICNMFFLTNEVQDSSFSSFLQYITLRNKIFHSINLSFSFHSTFWWLQVSELDELLQVADLLFATCILVIYFLVQASRTFLPIIWLLILLPNCMSCLTLNVFLPLLLSFFGGECLSFMSIFWCYCLHMIGKIQYPILEG